MIESLPQITIYGRDIMEGAGQAEGLEKIDPGGGGPSRTPGGPVSGWDSGAARRRIHIPHHSGTDTPPD